MPPRGPTIAKTALQLIQEQGPQPLDALVTAVVAAGRTRAKDPRRAVTAAIDINPEFVQAWDERWCSLADQLDGATFTTPLTTLEQQDEVVVLGDQLVLVERLAMGSRPFTRGGDVHLHNFGEFFDLPWPTDALVGLDMREVLGRDLAQDLLGMMAELGSPAASDEQEVLRELLWATRHVRVLHGPAGWLPTLGRRQLLGIRIRSGAVETMALDRRDVTGPHVGIVGAQVARLARLVIGPDASWFGPPVISLEELLELVATEAPEIFRRPLPPFTEVVERGGLEIRDGWIGHRGTDWDSAVPLDSAAGLPFDPEQAWGFEPDGFVH